MSVLEIGSWFSIMYEHYHRLWFIRRSVDRTKKRNVGHQEFLSMIGPNGDLIFTQRKGEILVFTSMKHAMTIAPSGSGLSITPYELLRKY